MTLCVCEHQVCGQQDVGNHTAEVLNFFKVTKTLDSIESQRDVSQPVSPKSSRVLNLSEMTHIQTAPRCARGINDVHLSIL